MSKPTKKIPNVKLSLRELAVIQDVLHSYAEANGYDLDQTPLMRMSISEVARISMILNCFMNACYPKVSQAESDKIVMESV